MVLVDGASAGATDALMKAVAALPGAGPVQTLFNTHWHPEHTGSNEPLGKAGKTIIAHENTRLWLTTDVTWPWNGRRSSACRRWPSRTRPSTRPARSTSGVRYGYIPDAAHTDGDLYVHFPDAERARRGRRDVGQGWPVVDYVTGGWIGGLVGAHQRLLTLAERADAHRPGPRAGAQPGRPQGPRRRCTATIYERLSTVLNKGRGPAEAVEAKPTKEFDAQMGNPRRVRAPRVREPVGYLSPDA